MSSPVGTYRSPSSVWADQLASSRLEECKESGGKTYLEARPGSWCNERVGKRLDIQAADHHLKVAAEDTEIAFLNATVTAALARGMPVQLHLHQGSAQVEPFLWLIPIGRKRLLYEVGEARLRAVLE